ncbi:FtsK/SpoIIIE family DNA translocase [Effusibacillus dendaii]|nr:DNA translocase FtsK [Effusibacillus dendaii]
MAKRKKSTGKTKQFIKYEILGLLLLAVAILSFAGMGPAGRILMRVSMYTAGISYWMISGYLIYLAVYFMVKQQTPRLTSRHLGILLAILTMAVLHHYNLYLEILSPGHKSDLWLVTNERIKTLYDSHTVASSDRPIGNIEFGGGIIGFLGFSLLHTLFDTAGTLFVMMIMGVISLILISGKSLTAGLRKGRQLAAGWLRKWAKEVKEAWHVLKSSPPKETAKNKNVKRPAETRTQTAAAVAEPVFDDEQPLKIRDFADQVESPSKHLQVLPGGKQNGQITIKYKERQTGKAVKSEVPNYEETDPLVLQMQTADNTYELPPLDLLEAPYGPRTGGDHKDLESNALKLQETLASFGVQVKVTEAHRGPTVTRYEVQPAIGVKVSRIVNLADDLALALAAKDIRIEAPIPGKSAVGIEVPNREVAIVTLREVIESNEFLTSPSKLSTVLGRDISGEPIVGSLAKMPHLLVAGATGAGKSVCINGIIASILYKAKPSEVKFIMIDPKMVELNVYNGIPHLLAPVVTDPRRAAYALKKVVQEMEHRYELFAAEGTRNMESYNSIMQQANKSPLPYIVVIIDELADLMMVAPTDVEEAIIRLAQMARAAGIHLILATQRPSVDVITGVIKANIPSRIAFAVSSQMDSRTILDMGGAEKLLGRGDMLYLPVGESKPVRVQGAFVSEAEVERLVSYVKEQQGAAYHLDLSEMKEESTPEEGELDSLFWEAVKLVVESEQASVSMLQRRLKVGYSRAARLVDQMEERGIVGRFEGSKPREVLLSKEQWSQMQNGL